ncbi:MAG: leucine-rich repeat protein [Tannerella sp.]|jgi:hypothetical protein|nr:leucine-rich repeat protein [Tannerella sp.]
MPGNIIINGLIFTPEDIGQIADAVVAIIQTTAKDPSQYEVVDSVEGVTSLPVFKQSGNAYTLVRVLTSLLKGADGKQIELKANETHLQWRLLGAANWIDLLPISILQEPAKDAIELYGQEISNLNNMTTQLGLTKFDSVDKRDDGLWFLANGVEVAGPIEVGSGGGGGSGGYSNLRLQNLGESTIGIPKGQPVILRYSFTSVDNESGDPTGNGNVVYFVGGSRVYATSIPQGENSFDISRYLADGSNTVRIQVTDSYGATRSISILVEVVNLQLSSTFNDRIPYNSTIQFPYTPVGSGEKTIHFVLDGTELDPVVTTASNRQLYYTLPVMPHGSHLLEVYAAMTVNGVILSSQKLYYDIIYVVSGNNNVIISSVFNTTEAIQYDTIAIPYLVYNPASQNTNVKLKANGIVISELVVGRTLQTWSYRIQDDGNLTLEIVSGTSSRIFNLAVTKSDIDGEAETENLELFLTSNGRSNNEASPSSWKYNNISATLSGFNFKTNGWVLDDKNVTVLRVSAGASVNIPFKPFATDFRGTGKTIEFDFSTRDIENYNAVVVSCMSGGRGFRITAQEVLFASELSTTTTQYKENEHVRISFVVENTLKNRLIYTYINGIMSGVIRYAENDNFAQNPAVGISIGSQECTIDIYNIRSYAVDLNEYQVLGNFIADMADVNKKLAVFDRNQIYDSTGDIVYSLLLRQIPCMTIIGDLPTYKGDKKTVAMAFENLQNPDRSFTATGVEIDVQGTSSQYYPRKNFKHKLKNGLTLTETGEYVSKYKLNENAIAVSTFCEKADFAESSGTHNTGVARYVDYMLRTLNLLTPPQQQNPSVRTTVDGYPIAIFHRETESAPLMFVGKYNFNNDKSTEETFGFSGTAECWEFLNNTSDRCLFKSADFTSNEWLQDFEGRYPDGNTDPTNLQAVCSWIVSCIGNPAKFKSQLDDYFVKKELLFYYIVTEFFGMVDQRAKNMMLTLFDKWRFIFYDSDTMLGINNEGLNTFGYDIEAHDQDGSGFVWNGHNSELWKLVEEAFPEELAMMYVQLRQSGALSYQKALEFLNTEQSDKWSEVVYNLDGRYKYIQPLIESRIGTYLYAAQGSRAEHRKWWLSNRFKYIDSKYNAADFLNDYVTMRLYTPETWSGIKPNADFMLTPYLDSYLRVKYGSYIIAVRAKAGTPINIQAPDIQFNDTETIIYGASAVKGLGDLSAKYAGTVDISNATKLTELIIGSNAEGYDNKNLHSITVGNNTLLKKLDVRNCSGLSAPIDVSGCENIEEIYASGTAITSIVLPPAGNLQHMVLPGTLANLTLKNQPVSDANLVIADILNISTLVLENLPNVDIWAFALNLMQTSGNKLERLRLVGIDVRTALMTDFSIFDNLVGLDENNITTAHAVITGSIHFDIISDKNRDKWTEYYPDLMITYDVLDAVIVFEDPLVKQICIENWDTNGDGELSTLEAEAVTDYLLGSKFVNTAITKFNELRYFKGLERLSGSAFNNCNSLTEVTIPSSVTATQDWKLNKNSLKVVRFEESTNAIACGDTISVYPYRIFPPSVEEIHINRNFYRGAFVGSPTNAPPFYSQPNLSKLIFGNNVTSIPDFACSAALSLTELIIPENVLSIGQYFVDSSFSLTALIFRGSIPPAAVVNTFVNLPAVTVIYVPDASVNAYKTAENWSVVADRIKPVSEKV